MNNVEVICDACEARMQLSESLLNRIAGKTGRITCKQCANKVALDATGDELRVTEGGSLVASDLELEEIDDAPNSGVDLIDPAFSEFPAEIKIKADPEADEEAAATTSSSEASAPPTSVPPPLPVELKERRRQSLSASAPGGEAKKEEEQAPAFEAPAPPIVGDESGGEPSNLPDDAEDEDRIELAHPPPSSPFSSERDETFRSLYPDPAPVQEIPKNAPLPVFSKVPVPPGKKDKERSGETPLTPVAVVLGPDGKLHNRAEYEGTQAGRNTWLPWTVAAISLLGLGVSLAAQLNGGFRRSTMEMTGAEEAQAEVSATEVDPVSSTQQDLEDTTVSDESAEKENDGEPSESAPEEEETPTEGSPKVKSDKASADGSTKPMKSDDQAAKTKSAEDTGAEQSTETSSPSVEGAAEVPGPVIPPFDQSAANSALNEAAAISKSCRRTGDPAGTAQVVITFASSGRVTRSMVSGSPYAGTPLGGCIAQRFRAATIPAFSGESVTLNRTVTIP